MSAISDRFFSPVQIPASTHDVLPLVRLQGANVSLDSHPILENVDFELEVGQHWAVLGGNGAGKSTLLRLLAGQIWPHPHTTRSYGFEGVHTWSPLRAREQLVLLSPEVQDRYVRKLLDGPDNETGWKLTARQTVFSGYFGSELLHQTPSAVQAEAAALLIGELGLNGLAERPMQTLSQGQMRRVLLARALVSRPRMLLLDEACSGLDRLARREMLELIERVAHSGHCQIVMTTHRTSEIVPAISHVLTLAHGRVLRRVQRHEVGRPQPEIKSEIQPPCGPAEPLTPGGRGPVARSANGEVAGLPILIELQNVDVSLDGTPILHQLNWQLRMGEQYAIAGANGAGKSTFLRLLRGELAPALGGTIRRFGTDIRRALWDIGRDIALLSPAVQARFRDEIAVEAAIGSGFEGMLGAPGPLSPAQHERVGRLMELCQLQNLAGRTFGRLSYGQTRRVLLARALVHAPRVLLLDEALDGLDAQSREEMSFALETLARQGTSLVVVSHHEEDWPSFLTHVLELRDGRIVASEELL